MNIKIEKKGASQCLVSQCLLHNCIGMQWLELMTWVKCVRDPGSFLYWGWQFLLVEVICRRFSFPLEEQRTDMGREWVIKTVFWNVFPLKVGQFCFSSEVPWARTLSPALFLILIDPDSETTSNFCNSLWGRGLSLFHPLSSEMTLVLWGAGAQGCSLSWALWLRNP